MNSYEDFIEKKSKYTQATGFDINETDIQLIDCMFGFQKKIVEWSLMKGKAAIFADTGRGKSIMILSFLKAVREYTNKPVCLLTPLAVNIQFKLEAEKFGISNVCVCSDSSDIIDGINIINYEKIHKFDDVEFGGVALDESSIIKSFDGKIRTQIIDRFKDTQFKLAASATPSPNDISELGNHAEFFGIMKFAEMLSMFFINDVVNSDDSFKWRIKKHAEEDFWKWIASWAVFVRKPSDVGKEFEQEDHLYDLIPYKTVYECVSTEHDLSNADNTLFKVAASTLSERIEARRLTVEERNSFVANDIISMGGKWVVWCARNDESNGVYKLLKDSDVNVVEVSGADSYEQKEKKIIDFTKGIYDVLVTKPSICGFGMNWQHVHQTYFNGLNDSYEQLYQAIRRFYRYGQEKQVIVKIAYSELEGNTVDNIIRKDKMNNNMYNRIKKYNLLDYRKTDVVKTEYNPKHEIKLPDWI